jgi:ribosomal protein S18 acetylase RimI-like enzyme
MDRREGSIKAARREDFQDLAAQIVKISQTPSQHCLHSWAGEDSATLAAQLEKYLDDDELTYVLVRSGGSITAAMGAEYDEQLRRAWLHGPHVFSGEGKTFASEIYEKLLSLLPGSLKTLDAYLNIENNRAQEFYRNQGFVQNGGLSHEYFMRADQHTAAGTSRCGMLKKNHEETFLTLYHDLFPSSYFSGERILEMIGTSHQVFVIAEEDDVLGFSIPAIDETGTRGEVQFVAVRKESRGKGYGRDLLQSAVAWIVRDQQAAEVTLNVREELTNARTLYESVGFRLRYTGIPFRRKLFGR